LVISPFRGALNSLLDRLEGHSADVSAGDAEVGKVPVGEARQFGHSVPAAAPVPVRLHYVHFVSSFENPSVSFFLTDDAKIGAFNRLTSLDIAAQHRSKRTGSAAKAACNHVDRVVRALN
jgi:hypothetical protein